MNSGTLEPKGKEFHIPKSSSQSTLIDEDQTVKKTKTGDKQISPVCIAFSPNNCLISVLDNYCNVNIYSLVNDGKLPLLRMLTIYRCETEPICKHVGIVYGELLRFLGFIYTVKEIY